MKFSDYQTQFVVGYDDQLRVHTDPKIIVTIDTKDYTITRHYNDSFDDDSDNTTELLEMEASHERKRIRQKLLKTLQDSELIR